MSNDPYILITSDPHAGANHATYREYLDPQWRDEFDAWRGAYKNPSKKHVGSKKTKNWDSEERRVDLEGDGDTDVVVVSTADGDAIAFLADVDPTADFLP